MANRLYENRAYALEKMPVTLYGIITCTGANGAQTLTRAKGFTSVVQTTTGIWTVTFQDIFPFLLEADVVYQGAPGAADSYITANNTNTTAKTLVLQNVNNAGAAASPSASQITYLTITFSNSNST
jgi:hypothetical protein